MEKDEEIKMSNKFASRLDGLSGSAIREIFKLLANPNIISFAGGNPAPESFPKEKLAEISRRVLLEDGERILQYGPTRGYKPLMEEVLKIAESQGINADLSNIIITSGSSQGLELMAKTFINKGDTILVESPTFIGAIQTFKTYEANLVAVDTDEQGILLDDLEAKIKKHSPKFLYAIPTFQNPSGVTLAEERREKLVKICSENGVKVLEDDPYGDLRYSGDIVSTLKKFDTDDTVMRLVSFSKIISPGIRVGAAIGDAEVISKFEMFKQGMDVHTTNLAQVMVYEYIKSGELEGHVQDVIKSYSEKKKTMLDLIESEFPKDIKISPCDGGLFIWLTLPLGVDTLDIFKKAVFENVAFVPGTHFFAQGGNNNTLRLNFSMVSKEKIEEGMKIIGKVIKDNI